MSERMFSVADYAAAVLEQFSSGHAKEHAYRPALERLMSSMDDILAVNDPKRSAHGNPDFVFLKQSNREIILGYAEAKDVTVDLDKTEKAEQLRRYAGYDNLFLTNYLEFRFFKNGEKYESISIGEIVDNELRLEPERYQRLELELKAFLSSKPENIKSGKRLALIMGAKAMRIRDNVRLYLEQESQRNEELEKIYQLIKTLLVHDLSKEKFADMYAQTLVYGLFAARYNDPSPETFTRAEARDLVPASNPFLREFFDHIAGSRFDTRLKYIVDELCEIFSVSDVRLLVQKHLRLFEVENEKDPIIHFYEDFLREYDPAERKKMGAYYTPLPVVQFIVREVDRLLKEEFGIADGLASTEMQEHKVVPQGRTEKKAFHRVQILDPATGTATFLNEIIRHVHKGFQQKGQLGRWQGYVERDLIPRLYGFELMMAPYTIAHLKLGLTLRETGIGKLDKRLGVYLTNTLEEGVNRTPDIFTALGLADAVTKEAVAASEIKHERPIMVVVGNPPYSGESSNKTDYAMNLVAKYKVEPGGQQKLQERNPKWINDDYVKFLAFAEDLIQKNGSGIVAMITNNGYLDNPTFRGMRWKLMTTFSQIQVINLHGDSKKKEIASDGGKDENVFDITQGVSIILAVKNVKKSQSLADVYHADFYGKRRKKFELLSSEVNLVKLNPSSPSFSFSPRSTNGQSEYEKGVSLSSLFTLNSVGIVTARDNLAIQYTEQEMWNTLNDFALLEVEKARSKYNLGSDARDWTVNGAQRDIRTSGLDRSKITKIAYRPFDDRYTYYTGNSRGFQCMARARANFHFIQKENIALVFNRRVQSARSFADIFISDLITDARRISVKETNYFAPLWFYHDDGTRTLNFDQDELKKLIVNLSKEPKAEQVFDYIYAVLHSPKYRKKYSEFLKTDFPRIPIPKNDEEFLRLAEFGKELRELHLMTSPIMNQYQTTYPVGGSDLMEALRYKDEKVWINDAQYFGNVPEVAWNFYIGGYQPAQKWLKDRKGRRLTSEDLDHYQKIIKVLMETYRIMQEIDQ